MFERITFPIILLNLEGRVLDRILNSEHKRETGLQYFYILKITFLGKSDNCPSATGRKKPIN